MENLFKFTSTNEENKTEKLRPCCVCKETKEIRDNCIFEKGEESCLKFIEEHNKCLKDYGFIIEEK